MGTKPALPKPPETYVTEFKKLVEETKNQRKGVRMLTAKGKWLEADDQTRVSNFLLRKKKKRGAEAIQGNSLDWQESSFLAEGSTIRRAIGFVEVRQPGNSSNGSGFMISPQLFITNNHVILDKEAARHTRIIFDREYDEFGNARVCSIYSLDPERFFYSSEEGMLDFSIIAIGQLIEGDARLEEFGYCPLSNSPDRHVVGMNVNIIHHPMGMPKKISIRKNVLSHRTEKTLLYETDTEHGSSGAPVFNDDWDLVALHHYGEPFLEKKDEDGVEINNNVNEGVRISYIYNYLEEALQASQLNEEQKQLLAYALSLGKNTGSSHTGKKLIKKYPESLTITNSSMEANTLLNTAVSTEHKIHIPLEISIRIGGSTNGHSSVHTNGHSPAHTNGQSPAVKSANENLKKLKVRSASAEAMKLDTDYDNRSGFDPSFIPGVKIPLPVSSDSLFAPLNSDQKNYKNGELKYQHFSIKLHKTKKMALFTATNIDGNEYLKVDRKTGKVSMAEGEKWFYDERIDAKYYLDQAFYSDWSHYFDRGHLTRRTDPTWGTPEEAERANADTFHFTNCSPQHFRFNQTAKFWQGAERFVLENGLLASQSGKRIAVFQGPIFNEKRDLWSDDQFDVQIPSSFFKIVVWQGEKALKSVGLIVDQIDLMDEQRKFTGQPKELKHVDVSHWRVPIEEIEEDTGLDFGDLVRKADTIKQKGQPTVGGEAARRIYDFKDILL
ncbi:MAG TPA: DNA/RNA non-specific endonuclease [Flavobacteriales bacterium]|nr:DNA/RNA non-specific endonuclease [Flavobacteriales bacterium]